MSAIISKCGSYRYRLERTVGTGRKTCLFIMFNPSVADATVDDRTIGRCISFAASFGCGKLIVGNLFAYRTAYTDVLKKHAAPEGPNNLRHLRKMCGEADIVIAAWGEDGLHLGQGERIRRELEGWGVQLHFLKLTKHGIPRHPLYLKGDLKPQRWTL